jgi:RNA recognition motif-containing protein
MKLRILLNPTLIIFIVIFQLLKSVSSLHCIQCDRQENWYSPEKNEEHIQRCHKGEIEPTKCKNSTHTHCIYSYYRRGGATGILSFGSYNEISLIF